jgi:hypothetical protein
VTPSLLAKYTRAVPLVDSNPVRFQAHVTQVT